MAIDYNKSEVIVSTGWKCKLIDNIRNLIIRLPVGKKTLINIVINILGMKYRFVGNIQGIQMVIDSRDWNGIFNIYISNGFYEYDVMKLLKSNLSAGGVFVDVGANKGFYSFIARNIVGDAGYVLAYEPVAVNYNDIIDTIKINGWKNINIIQKAVSNENSISNLNIIGFDVGHSGWSYLSKYKTENSVSVNTVTLDQELFQIPAMKIDLLKMDIEGGEKLAICGAKEILIKKIVKNILLELHIGKLGLDDSYALVVEMENYGYRVEYIGDAGKNFLNWMNDNKSVLNGLLPGERVHVFFTALN